MKTLYESILADIDEKLNKGENIVKQTTIYDGLFSGVKEKRTEAIFMIKKLVENNNKLKKITTTNSLKKAISNNNCVQIKKIHLHGIEKDVYEFNIIRHIGSNTHFGCILSENDRYSKPLSYYVDSWNYIRNNIYISKEEPYYELNDDLNDIVNNVRLELQKYR